MAVNARNAPAPPPLIKNSAASPFIYFDSAPAYGTGAGNIEVELAARVLMPRADGKTVIADAVSTGHLRCSVQAAMSLIDALSSAIDMVRKQQAQGESEHRLAS